MSNSKLVQMLNTLSDEEWKEFEKYTESPFFNGGRNYLPILKFFKNKKGKEGLTNPAPEKLYAKLYHGKPFNKNVINTMLSGFTKIVEGFFIQKDYETINKDKKLALLRQLELRNCDDLFRKEVLLSIKRTNEFPFDLDVIDFLRNIQHLINRSNYKTNFDKNVEVNVIRRADYFFFTFYVHMLNEERDLVVMQNVLNKKNPGRLSSMFVKNIDSEYILSYIEKNYPDFSHTLGLIILCFTSRDYFRIKKSFFEHYKLLNTYLALNLTYVIEGLLFELITEGKRELIYERHLLHRFILENNLIINDRIRSMNTRVTENFINIALWNKEFGWLELFIEKYSTSFANDMKDSLLKYSHACLCYGKREFAEALKLLLLVDDAPISMKWRMKDIELQILFELKEFDRAFYAIDNYVKFMNSKSVSPINKKVMQVNISSYKTLIIAVIDSNHKEIGMIGNKLQHEMPSQFGDWIIEKSELYSNKKK